MELNNKNVNELLQEEINPSLAIHNGFVSLSRVEENRVILSFHGGCAGCPSSLGATLFQIQNYMIEHFQNDELVVENAEFAE